MHHNVIIKDGDTTKAVKKVLVDGVQFVDDDPIECSSNLVSSNGVAKAIADTKDAVGDAAAALQEQIDDIAEKAGSGYIPKGEATVATLNGLSGQENGWLYTMTDAGTLTDGSVAVVAGDTVAWDATNSVWYKAMDYAPRQYGTNEVHNLPAITAFRTGDYIAVDGTDTAKMSKDDLLKVTAQNALDGNIAEKFDPTRTNDNRYIPGDVVCYQGKIYSFKNYHYGSWSSADAVLINGYDFDTSIYPKERFPYYIGGLTDCDLAEPGKIYFVTKNSANTLNNLPYDSEGIGYLSCYKSYWGFVGSGDYYVRQIYTRISPTYKMWLRSKNGTGTFSDWKELTLEQITIEIGQGKQFESLRSGIAYAMSLPASKTGPLVILYPGTYDVVSDFMTELNDIDNKTNQFGMKIDRSIHLVAMAGAKIVANVDEDVFPTYTDAQFNKIKELFNLFIVEAATPCSNIVFENLNIEAKNTRYCVHDELGSSVIPQIHKYINCTMKHTSDTREGLSRFPQCIGGGLGQNVDITINGGSYETIMTSGISSIQSGDIDFAEEPISWHNSSGGGVKSSISIQNVLLKGKGYFRFGYYGNTQTKSNIRISGCKMYYPPLVRRENDTALYENFDVQDYSCETVVEGTWNSTSTGAVSSVFVPNE